MSSSLCFFLHFFFFSFRPIYQSSTTSLHHLCPVHTSQFSPNDHHLHFFNFFLISIRYFLHISNTSVIPPGSSVPSLIHFLPDYFTCHLPVISHHLVHIIHLFCPVTCFQVPVLLIFSPSSLSAASWLMKPWNYRLDDIWWHCSPCSLISFGYFTRKL